jgi:methylated-DNA-[protein]-cysteine S-methyltransferase
MGTPAAAFTIASSPLGSMHLAASGDGIVAVSLETETPAFVDHLARRVHGSVVPAEDSAVPAAWRELLELAVVQIGEYLAGKRRTFGLPLDLSPLSDWDRRVLGGAAQLAYGEAVGYGELARRVGKPGAAQAVGGAMGRNPVMILIPCHRVIASGGRLGGYGGNTYADRRAGLSIKRRLLAIEGVRPEG